MTLRASSTKFDMHNIYIEREKALYRTACQKFNTISHCSNTGYVLVLYG